MEKQWADLKEAIEGLRKSEQRDVVMARAWLFYNAVTMTRGKATLPARKPHKLNPEVLADIAASKETVSALARRLKISRQSVYTAREAIQKRKMPLDSAKGT